MASPVRGLRPVRAARLPTENVPKPTKVTEPFFFKVFLTAPISASSARAEAAFETSASFAICSINSVLFTYAPFKNLLMSPVSVNHCPAYSFYSRAPSRVTQKKLQGVLNKGQSTVSSALQAYPRIKFLLQTGRLRRVFNSQKNAPKSVFSRTEAGRNHWLQTGRLNASPCSDRQVPLLSLPPDRSLHPLRSVRPAGFPAPLPTPCRSSVPE
jgi:hypothetical protein